MRRLFLSSIASLGLLIGFTACSSSDPAPLNSAANISSFELNIEGINIKLDQEAKSITIHHLPDIDLNGVKPRVLTSANATVQPASGEAVNLNELKKYTVTAQDGTKQDYEIILVPDYSKSLHGEWKIAARFSGSELIDPGVSAVAESNNAAIAAAIKKEIEQASLTIPMEVPMLGGAKLSIAPYFSRINIAFKEDGTYKIHTDFVQLLEDILNSEPGNNPASSGHELTTLEGKYTIANNKLSIDNFETVKLGGMKETLTNMWPMIEPMLPKDEEGNPLIPIEILDEDLAPLLSGFLNLVPEISITNAIKDWEFDAQLNLTENYNTDEKKASLIEAAGLEGVSVADVKVNSVIVTVKLRKITEIPAL